MENIYVCQRCFHKFNKNNGYNFINGRGPYCDCCYTFLSGKKSGTPLIVDLIKTGKSLGLRRIGLLLLPFSLGFYTLNLIVFIATIIIESFFIKRIYYKAYFSGTRLVHNKIQIKESTKKIMEIIITVTSIILLILSIPNIKALIQYFQI